MSVAPYSNREIDQMQKEIHQKLDLILAQTTKTNGRVSRLENWRSYTAGAIAVIVMFLVPILGWSINQIIHQAK